MSTPATARPKPHHATNEWAAATHVYEPHVVGLPPVRQYLREVWRRREFAVELSRTNLRAQHFDSVFGQLWLVLNPLMLAGVYFVLIDIVRRGSHPPDFFAHLTAGIFAYYFVSNSVRDGVKSVVSGGRLILNSAFPRMLLPLSSVIMAFKRFVPTAVVFIPIHVLSGLPVSPVLLWVVPLTFLFALLAAGFAMLAAAIQVYFRDLKNFLPYALRVALYASPVLYFAEQVPERYQFLLDINPLARLIEAWNSVLYFGEAPPLQALVVGTAWAVGAFVVGAAFFMSREREFAVRL
jgi:teichoic acid transport system permease protein